MNQDTENDKGPAVEQAADLAALQAAADGATATVTGAAVPAQGQAEDAPLPPPSPQALAAAKVLIKQLRPLATVALPALREAPDDYWEPIPEGIAVIMDHYGTSVDWMRTPWGRLTMALLPLGGFVAVQVLNKPKPAQALEAPPPVAQGSKSVVIGTVEA
ncbi:hypothetical protein [Roseateles microcysteis]|uniref:hypothetical protein n=1 Tax=Roseateles microcysteis TaxID=3119057 RepID=UPI002FE624F4